MKLLFTPVILALLIAATLLSQASACSFEDFRLYDNGAQSDNQGMLQICDQNGQWVAVCDYQWRQEFSVSVCKELNYTNPTPLTRPNSGYWNRLGYVSRYYSSYSYPPSCLYGDGTFLDCLTNSSSYLGSNYYYYYYYYCSPYRDTVYIQCNFTLGSCTPNDIRLYNETTDDTAEEGMLQICNSTGHWTAVCDYSWGCNEAQVACKQLGYSNPRAWYSRDAGPWPVFGYGPYSYCSTSYSSLFSCSSYSSYYRNRPGYCNPLLDTVRLGCTHSAGRNDSCNVNYQVRLVNGNETSEYIDGRAEICFNGEWTPICRNVYAYSGDSVLGGTLCNSLGRPDIIRGFASVIRDSRYGVSSNLSPIRSMYCWRTYDSVRSCSIYTYSSCSSYTCPGSLGVKCYFRGNCNEGQTRLVNGTLEREGRLEVCFNGVWGNVCPNNFRKSAAHVACKEAGYTDVMGAIIYTSGEYGPGNGLYVYGNVECFGHEQILSQCSKTVVPNVTCYANSGVGLLCKDNCTEGQVKLVGGRHAYEGYVQVCLDDVWTLVAKNGWDNADARIVCKQLKVYNHTAGVAVNNAANYTKPRRAIRYSNVYCRGQESMLMDCIHHTLELSTGRKYRGDAAAVDCKVSIPVSSTISTHSTATRRPPSITISTPSIPSVTLIRSNNNARPSNQRQTLNASEGSVLGTGIGLLVLAIAILVIGIIVMAFIIMRVKKLSISQGGRNNDRQQMSSLREEHFNESPYETVGTVDTKPINSSIYDDEQILS